MPEKRFKIEGVVTTHFEIELGVDALGGCNHHREEVEAEVENLIENDPSELFYKGLPGVNLTYREDRVAITSCQEMEPDWGAELVAVVSRAERGALTKIIKELPKDAQKKIVQALQGAEDEDED